MKKVILAIAVMVFTVPHMEAQDFKYEDSHACYDAAWSFGTFMGEGDSQTEYEMTNWYIDYYCQ